MILCDHASNRIPEAYQSFGFAEDALQTHIAWDPGASGGGAASVGEAGRAAFLARRLAPHHRLQSRGRCDAVLSSPKAKGARCRPIAGSSEEERSRRLANIHAPYHDAIDACLDAPHGRWTATALVAIHSFTPVYFGKARPWQIGILFDDDRRLADLLIGGLKADPALTVGINQPYSPADGVYYTLGRHAQPHDLPSAMIEIRNDEISGEAGQRSWAERLANILFATTPGLFEPSHAMV